MLSDILSVAYGSVPIVLMIAGCCAIICAGLLILYKTGYVFRKLSSHENFYNSVDEGIIILNPKGRIENMNRATVRLLGLQDSRSVYAEAEEKISEWKQSGSHLRSFRHPETGEREYRVVMGNRFGASVRKRNSILFITDETELHKAEERVRYLESYDDVTGLASRDCFTEMLQVAAQDASRLGEKMVAFCVSIANYSDYCSVYGTRFGDELLRRAGGILIECGFASRHISRFGNDEFYIFAICPEGKDTPEQLVERIVCRLDKRLSIPVVIDNIPVTLRFRMGAAFYPEHSDNTDRLISMAHLAKLNTGGSPCAVYQEELRFSSERYLLLSQHMPAALRQGEFFLVYQPQVRISDRKVIGVEVLLRWRSPELGQVSPAEFIPIAEETGLIHKMGMWVIRETIAQLAEWKKMNAPPIRVAVNVSVGQLSQPDFAGEVLRLLSESDIDPCYFELEMTESISLVPSELTCRQFEKLRRAGVRIAMDDFGMGHSSLAYITQWQFDIIKIDKVFASEILIDPTANAMVKTIQSLCDVLEIETVVECIEHEEQLPELLRLGCSVVQGYVFSPPLSPKDCIRYIKEHNTVTEPRFDPEYYVVFPIQTER